MSFSFVIVIAVYVSVKGKIYWRNTVIRLRDNFRSPYFLLAPVVLSFFIPIGLSQLSVRRDIDFLIIL